MYGCLDKICKFITSFCYKNEYREYEKNKKDLIEPQNGKMDKSFIVNILPLSDAVSKNDVSESDTSPWTEEIKNEYDWDIIEHETPTQK
jgi:hypothetical protein